MEKKMTAEEIIDSKYPFPAGKLKDVTLNGVQVKELMESFVNLSPLPDNNGVKDGFEKWLKDYLDSATKMREESIGASRDVMNGEIIAIKDTIASYRNFSLTANDGAKEPDGWVLNGNCYLKESMEQNIAKRWIKEAVSKHNMRPFYFSPPAKVEVSENNISRIEVIDSTGRIFSRWNKGERVEFSYQDEGMTLKLFIKSLG